MKPLLIGSLFCLAICGCKKPVLKPEPPVDVHPQMMYKDLQNAEVSFNHRSKTIDVDGDGQSDFSFGVLLLGDPVLQRDRIQFYAYSGVQRNLLNDANDQSPVLNSMDTISIKHQGYDWWQISAIVLAEKIITYTDTYWDGLWKNASHKYLPIQVEKSGKLYQGWIELSFSTTGEKLVLHKAALCKEEGKTIKAGYYL